MNLLRLVLNNNELHGGIPASLGSQASLLDVLLYRNKLNGFIPGMIIDAMLCLGERELRNTMF